MKTTPGILIAMAVLCMLPCFARADDGNINFTCVSRKVDQKTTTADKGEVTVNTEDWQYVVTLENTTFNDIATLQIKYIVFFKQEELGTLAGARLGRQTGSTTIDVIKGHDKVEFKTLPVKLEKASLDPSRTFNNGAKSEAEGNLAGLWVRIYQGGNLIAEMSRPSNLPSKEKWGE